MIAETEPITTPACPHCAHALTRSEIGALYASLRHERTGGRPRSRKKRCPCGEMTANRAAARGHVCEAPTLAPYWKPEKPETWKKQAIARVDARKKP